MKSAILIGVDPGIVDTGVVRISIDGRKKTFISESQVWRGVTQRVDRTIFVDTHFLESIAMFVENSKSVGDPVYVFIEGYRNRGRNPQQDQKMTHLVQEIKKAIPDATIVDNTGVKNVVTEDLLGLLHLRSWLPKTHHSDLKSAARIALKGAYQTEGLNELVATVVRDQLEAKGWTLSKHRNH